MAQITYRANLSAKVFPFISEYFGRSVIVSGPDQNFSRQLVSSEDLDKDRGIPQLYYAHNVMPMAEGFQSIGFTPTINDTKSGFSNIQPLRDYLGAQVFFSHGDDGANYVLPFGGTYWTQINTIPGTVGVAVTTAQMNGQTFIYFANVGCYLYNAASNTLLPITLTGLVSTDILGITSSAGYMIAWSTNTVAWSSTVAHAIYTDPIDFVPSLITGAGGGSIEAAKGKITICVAHYLGFIVYTTDNAIAGIYSGNSRFPFNFREIVASGGLANASLISFDSGTGNHYAYTTSGMQLVSMSQTTTIFPEITDFIAGKYFEDFNETTLALETQGLFYPMKKAINVISDRYLVISYGVSSLTHAIVFDIVQKRFGKLKIPHTSCFEFKLITPEVTETPRASIGFLQSNGSIKVVDFTYTSSYSSGVMILGKYQYVRARLMQLDSVSIENIKADSGFNLYVLNSINGKTTDAPVAGYLAENSGTYRKYNFRVTGINQSLLFKGKFTAVSLELAFNISGRR